MNLEPINVGYDGAHRGFFDLYNRIVWAGHHEAAVVPIRERIRRFLMYANWRPPQGGS